MRICLALVSMALCAGVASAATFSYTENFENAASFSTGHALGSSSQSGQLQGWDYTWTTANDYQMSDTGGIGNSRCGIVGESSSEVAYQFVNPVNSGTHVAIDPTQGDSVTTSVMVWSDHFLRNSFYGFYGAQMNVGDLGGASQFVNMMGFLFFKNDVDGDQLGEIKYNDGAYQSTGALWAPLQWYKITTTAHYDAAASAWNTWDCLIETVDSTGAATGTVWSATGLAARNSITNLQSGFYANVAGGAIDNFAVSQVPEPATMSLLGLAGLTMLRRRM